VYGCKEEDGRMLATCDDKIEYRYCKCPPGYTGSSLLFREAPFLGCKGNISKRDIFTIFSDINECVYSCDENSVCTEGDPNQRICTCNPGYNGTQTLVGPGQFTGCSGNSTPLCLFPSSTPPIHLMFR
jgi:hypothetical protein